MLGLLVGGNPQLLGNPNSVLRVSITPSSKAARLGGSGGWERRRPPRDPSRVYLLRAPNLGQAQMWLRACGDNTYQLSPHWRRCRRGVTHARAMWTWDGFKPRRRRPPLQVQAQRPPVTAAYLGRSLHPCHTLRTHVWGEEEMLPGEGGGASYAKWGASASAEGAKHSFFPGAGIPIRCTPTATSTPVPRARKFSRTLRGPAADHCRQVTDGHGLPTNEDSDPAWGL